jgi:UDP-2-acetamido-3-amino-2,3-dideoxy-glucuronate N-acetyltransferase
MVRKQAVNNSPRESRPPGMKSTQASQSLATVSTVRLVDLPIITDPRGSLSFAEYGGCLPFLPKRYFIVFDVPEGEVRGAHAHKKTEQFLVCVKGSVSILVDDGRHKEEVTLSSAAVGLYIPPNIWATQQNYSPDAVLLVLSSGTYDPDEYVKDYDEFRNVSTSR